MRKHLLAAGIAAITLIPTFAAAQPDCEERRNNRVAGTVVGGVLGAPGGQRHRRPRRPQTKAP